MDPRASKSPKCAKELPKTLHAEQDWNSEENQTPSWSMFRATFTCNSMPKGWQHRIKIGAKTHQQSLPKLVPNKFSKVIKSNVFVMGKIMQFHHTFLRIKVSQGACAKSRINKHITNETNFISRRNPYELHARKANDANNINIYQQMCPKSRLKSSIFDEQIDVEKRSGK